MGIKCDGSQSYYLLHPQRTLPGFWRQFGWCLGRAVTRRMREPLAVFTDYAIFALTGDGQQHIILHMDVLQARLFIYMK